MTQPAPNNESGLEAQTGPVASIVIPAHNESAVIGRLLSGLLRDARTGELRVVVVCNGCADDTAAIARTFPDTTVVEIERPSKIAALNAGDDAAGDVFPRMYLDADIAVSTAAVRRVAETLDGDEARAAAPRLQINLQDRPLTVRGYYEIFRRLPWVTKGLVGSGFYGVSRAGRMRFGRFPDVTNDDGFVRALFDDDERVSVADVDFTIEAPRSTRSLIRAKARVAAGTAEFMWQREEERRSRGERPEPPRGGSLIYLRLLRDPSAVPHLPAYVFVRVLASLTRTMQLRRGRTIVWGQDQTTRIR
jgi:glycosyltransferase involved in cell wall biosynthesis